MPGKRSTPTTGTFTKTNLNVLDATLAIDFSATFGLYCLFGQLETDRTGEALLYIHENYNFTSKRQGTVS